MTTAELTKKILHAQTFLCREDFKKELKVILDDNIHSIQKEEVEETEPFDIKKWTPETIVKQRQGKTVRILCTDLDDAWPVVGAVENESGELVIDKWCIDGRYDQAGTHVRDLVMVKPKPKTQTLAVFRDSRGIPCITSGPTLPSGNKVIKIELPL